MMLHELLGVRLGEPLPTWARPELVMTEPAAARLRAWVEAGGLQRAPQTPARVAASLNYIGDLGIQHVVVATLGALPTCVGDFICDHTEIFGVGRDSAGWVATAPPRRPRDAEDEETCIIALAGEAGDETLSKIVAHECSHRWLEAFTKVADNLPPAARLDELRTLSTLAHEWEMTEHLQPVFESAAARERRACQLQAVWGFGWSGIGEAACARGAVRHLRESLHPEGVKA